MRQLARLRFPGVGEGDALCQIGVLLKAEGQMRDALTAFELAADAARLIGYTPILSPCLLHHRTIEIRPLPLLNVRVSCLPDSLRTRCHTRAPRLCFWQAWGVHGGRLQRGPVQGLAR